MEKVIEQDSPQTIYRNPFLANAMVAFNMIDTIGGGIKKMFQKQQQRFFPLPTYDLTNPEKVVVTIPGKILNEDYTRLLIENTDMELSTAILLDKVQKQIRLTIDEHKFLKSKRFIEGRYPNLFVSSRIAAMTGEKARYIKNRGFDKKYYQDLIIAFIKKHHRASRQDINYLLLEKMPNILNEKQKLNKIKNILYEMSKKLEMIQNNGTDKSPIWILKTKTNSENN